MGSFKAAGKRALVPILSVYQRLYPGRPPLFVYHRVNRLGKRDLGSISPEDFEAQMAYLRNTGYEPVTMSTLIAGLRGEATLPHRTCALTFDDGYRDNHTYAWPILRRYGFVATIFLVNSFVGQTRQLPQNRQGSEPCAPGLSQLEYLTWPQIREMIEDGIEFGAHTLTHPRLTMLAEADAEHEIKSSKSELEKMLNRPIKVFAYPYGDYNAQVREIVARVGYTGACTTAHARVEYGVDLYALPRIPGGRSLFEFLLGLVRTTKIGNAP